MLIMFLKFKYIQVVSNYVFLIKKAFFACYY